MNDTELRDTANRFFVSVSADGQTVAFVRPVSRVMHRSDALNLAAWIVACCDLQGREFDELLRRVREY